jgi:acyl dehydratase
MSSSPGGRDTLVRMTTNGEKAFVNYKAAVGAAPQTGDWFLVDQDRINAFAEVTEDRQFIHVDPEASAQLSPWGVPIAHGFLTLSLLTVLCASVPQDPKALEGILMGVNYGFDKVRFVAPVKVGSRVRASQVVSTVDLKDVNNLQVTRTITVEIEGESKPALVAEWITRLVYG